MPVSAGDAWRLLQVVALTTVAPLLTRALPPERLARSFRRGRSTDAEAKLRCAEWLFRRWGRRRWLNCFSRALVRYRYLCHSGRSTCFHLGIGRSAGAWTGHAWVSVAGEPYAETEGYLQRFTEMWAVLPAGEEPRAAVGSTRIDARAPASGVTLP